MRVMGRGAERPSPRFFLGVNFRLDLNSFRELNLHIHPRSVFKEVTMQDFTLLRVSTNRLLFIILGLLVVPLGVNAQGSGKSSTGTGGIHVIQGYIFFPSGRRAETNIVVKLESYNSGELEVIPDSSGAFTFSNLAPGNYTVVTTTGDDYEVAREGVYIDTDLNLSRMGAQVPPTTRRYTVMVHLQLKAKAANKPAVLNAALAAVPEKARQLYERALKQADEPAKAAESLKEAIALYPNFPLA